MRVALLVLALAAADQATPPPPQTTDARVDRVRAALERQPSKLALPDVQADFRVHIEVRRPLQDIFDRPPWQLPPIGWTAPPVAYSAFGATPMVTVNMLPLVDAVARTVRDIRHTYALRNASEEVQRAIAEYCAAQANAATISICSGSAAAR